MIKTCPETCPDKICPLNCPGLSSETTKPQVKAVLILSLTCPRDLQMSPVLPRPL